MTQDDRMTLRVSLTLLKQIKKAAKKDGRSVAEWVLNVLTNMAKEKKDQLTQVERKRSKKKYGELCEV